MNSKQPFFLRAKPHSLLSRDNHLSSGKKFGRRPFLKGATALGIASAGLLGSPLIKRILNIPLSGVALADIQYDGAAAASWADQYALSADTDYSSQTQGGDFESRGDDCTNFASNAMFNGGFPMDDQWYSFIDGNGQWQYGISGYHPWTVAPDLYNYLQATGYGQLVNSFVGPQRGITPTNGLAQGDLVFFSWSNDGNIDHMAFQTVGGVDSNGYPYDQVDAHTDDRLHVFWTLEDFWSVPDPNNVAIYAVHIVFNTASALYLPTY